MKKLILLVPVLFLVGCATSGVSALSTTAAVYCAKPEAERELFRAIADTKTAPNKVRILCAGDVTE